MLIGARCGVFVKAGANGDGSQANPFGSIVEAANALGEAAHIYVCGGDAFAGSVSMNGGVSVTGSIRCDDWRYSRDLPRPKIVGSADVPALTISGAGEGALVSIDVEAPAAMGPGASSIAMVVEGATVTGDLMNVVAGDGAPGAAPLDPPAALSPAASGANGADFGEPVSNAAGGSNSCGTTMLVGGAGGKGGQSGVAPTSGSAGDEGNGGAAGAHQVGSTLCTEGGAGAPGHVGSPGAGATGFGVLSVTGFVPDDGGDGVIGSHGASGGGGGGAISTHQQEGPGGGGGGAGGCRGAVGAGGKGGGSSIALVALDATVTFDIGVRLSVGKGGAGGDGERGQVGQSGGAPGAGGSGPPNACAGGHGGLGGHGGNGGGGRGGHSIAVVDFGGAVEGGERDISGGVAGSGGLGGDNMVAEPGGEGASGLLADTLTQEGL